MEGYITERDMLRQMESGAVFSLKWVGYDRKRKTGGKVQDVLEARLLRPEAEAAEGERRDLTPAERRKLREAESKRRTDPNHKSYYTRNLRILTQGQPSNVIRKFHPPLVLQYNGKRVVP